MPEQDTIKRAMDKKRRGKKPSTQAGEFVREEVHHIREGKHGARSTKQAIAIGLSKARRAGVNLPPPKKGKTAERTRAQAKRDYAKARVVQDTKRRPNVGRRRCMLCDGRDEERRLGSIGSTSTANSEAASRG